VEAPPPPRATQVCGLGFGNPGSYQGSFYALGQGNTGWVTADGFVPVDLQDGRTAWWMSDTMTGTPNPDNSVPNAGNEHNSFVMQGGECLTPSFNPVPQQGSAWYWPGSAVVTGGSLTVFAYKVVPGPDRPDSTGVSSARGGSVRAVVAPAHRGTVRPARAE
jgi:hypothetical protein